MTVYIAKTYAIYSSDGSIDCVFFGSEEDLLLNVAEGQSYLLCTEGVDCERHYVRDGAVLEKSEFPEVQISSPLTVGATITVSNLPANTKVQWPDFEVTTEADGELSFDASVGGSYPFVFTHPEYICKRMSIDVA